MAARRQPRRQPGEASGRPGAVTAHLSWEEVALVHRSRWGIAIEPATGRARSILTDEGFSGYRNRWAGGRLHYQGDGRHGHQEPVRGNAALLAAAADRAPVRVFEKVNVNDWNDLGCFQVVAVSYRRWPGEDRRCFEFVLDPASRARGGRAGG